MDHPGDFSNHVGDDLYLNPWWGIRRPQLSRHAQCVVALLNEGLGEPDLWFDDIRHRLLWRPRSVPEAWRPGFCVAVSGNGNLYSHFWLPWRGQFTASRRVHTAHVLDTEFTDQDVDGARLYIEIATSRSLRN